MALFGGITRFKYRGIVNNKNDGYLFAPPMAQRVSKTATTDTFNPYYDFTISWYGAAATKTQTMPVASAAYAGAVACISDTSNTASGSNPINIVDTASLAIASINAAGTGTQGNALWLQCVPTNAGATTWMWKVI